MQEFGKTKSTIKQKITFLKKEWKLWTNFLLMEAVSPMLNVKVLTRIVFRNVSMLLNLWSTLILRLKSFSYNLTTTVGQSLKFWALIVLNNLLLYQNVQNIIGRLFKIITKKLVIKCMKWLNSTMWGHSEFPVLHIFLLMEDGMTRVSQYQWKRTILQLILLVIGLQTNQKNFTLMRILGHQIHHVQEK